MFSYLPLDIHHYRQEEKMVKTLYRLDRYEISYNLTKSQFESFCGAVYGSSSKDL